MKIYPNRYENQVIYSNDIFYKVDQKKLVKWLKHMMELNNSLMNDLSRDDIQRAKDAGRYDAYSSILFNIQHGTIITK